MLKQVIRNTMRGARSRLSPEFQERASVQICKHILQLPEYIAAKRVAIYAPIQNEVDLSFLRKSANITGKTIFYPVIRPKNLLWFKPASLSSHFIKNQYGVKEPDVPDKEALEAYQLDLIFLPLLAFDDRGTRLGMGAGYYDRSLAEHKRAVLVGAAYAFQKESYIEPNEWDIPLDLVLTEKGVLRFI